MKRIFSGMPNMTRFNHVGILVGELAGGLCSTTKDTSAVGLVVTTEHADTKDVFRGVDTSKLTNDFEKLASFDLTSVPDAHYVAAIVSHDLVGGLAAALYEKQTIDSFASDGGGMSDVIMILGDNSSSELLELLGSIFLHSDERMIIVAGAHADTIIRNLAGADAVIMSGERVQDTYELVMRSVFPNEDEYEPHLPFDDHLHKRSGTPASR